MTVDWSAYLDPGEHLIWQGAPRPGVRRGKIILYNVLGIPLLAMGLLALGEGLGFRARGAAVFFDFAMAAMGLMFVLGGLYLIIGLWIHEARRHRWQRYALSDRRAFVATGRSVDTIPLRGHAVDATLSEDGSGTIFFGARDKWNKSEQREAFEGIDDAAHVKALIEKASGHV